MDRRPILSFALAITIFSIASLCRGQEPSPSSSPTPSVAVTPEEEIVPTFETQKLARTYVLDIPAPRGQITDRTGAALAQNKVSYNLAILFPTPLDFTDAAALSFARDKINKATRLIDREIKIPDDVILRHYHNRGILPFEVAQNLSASECDEVRDKKPEGMMLRPIYIRTYPNGKTAGQIIGYTGRTGRNLDGIIDNHETLWPETEGREGLEQTFNEILKGRHGEYKLTFDKDGRKTSEKLITPPVPGNTVITSIDLHLQDLAEKSLEAKAKRGAIVILDPNNGDILAMASCPTYDPNQFVPSISAEKYKALQNDPDIPLLPRAFRAAYPPGSVFKVAVGIAALETGAVAPNDEYGCPKALEVGNTTMHNWKKVDRGSLNFVEALTESCDTWFYQVGIKTGAEPIIDWALQLGFGAKCGIPLRGEVEGRIPDDNYMKATHGRKLLNGDIANISIGQGDVLVTPLQMAQAMAMIGNGGTFYQSRLVHQVETYDNDIVSAYQVRAKRTLDLTPMVMDELRTGMVDAVSGGAGTAHAASLDNIDVAGKTGTAQWGPKDKERTAAWFAGFLPARNPQYAFAAVYEGDVGATVHGGSHAAPLIGSIFKQVYSRAPLRAVRVPKAQPSEQNVKKAEPVEDDQSD